MRADVGVQFGQMITRRLSPTRDFAIPFPPKQLIHKIGHRDVAVARELKAAEDVH